MRREHGSGFNLGKPATATAPPISTPSWWERSDLNKVLVCLAMVFVLGDTWLGSARHSVYKPHPQSIMFAALVVAAIARRRRWVYALGGVAGWFAVFAVFVLLRRWTG